MKKGRFTEEQIIGVLKQHEAGRKVLDLRLCLPGIPPRQTCATVAATTCLRDTAADGSGHLPANNLGIFVLLTPGIWSWAWVAGC